MSRRAGWQWVDAAAVAALLVLFAALHWLWDDPWGADLQPTPDAVEYVGAAESWLRHGVPALELSDGGLYPSRYAAGFPTVLAAWMAATGGGQVAGLSLNWILGFAIVALTYLMGRHLAGRLGAFAAGVLVTLSPNVADMTELIMTEPLTTLLTVGVTAIAVARAQRGRPTGAIAIGVLAGLLCTIRLTHLLTLAYVVPVALVLRRRGRWRDLRWGLVGFLPFVALVAAAQWWLNGSPWRQGYDLWASYATTLGTGWHWRFFFLEGKEAWEAGIGTRLHPHIQTHVPMLLGLVPRGIFTIMFHGWPILVGIVWAMVENRRHPLRRRWAEVLLIALAVQWVVWSVYYYWAPRFFMPLMPLVILLGCAGLVPRPHDGWSARNLVRGGLLALALWQQICAVGLYLGSPRPWSLSERRSLEALSEIAGRDALVIIDTHAVLARGELVGEDSPRRVMNWAIHGRDILLHESRVRGVPPVRDGQSQPAALFNEDNDLDREALAEVEKAWADGRQVWIALYAPPPGPHTPAIDSELSLSRLNALRHSGRGVLDPVDDVQVTVYDLWIWRPHASPWMTAQGD